MYEEVFELFDVQVISDGEKTITDGFDFNTIEDPILKYILIKCCNPEAQVDLKVISNLQKRVTITDVIKDLEASVPDLCKANKVGKWESTINYELDKMIVETAEIIFNIAINRLIDVSLKEKDYKTLLYLENPDDWYLVNYETD